MALPYFHVDAFTGSLFAGNPAGVCPLADWLPAKTMQRIAAEHNLAETAFFVHRDSAYELRWFTPTVEVVLCGHATLASAHVLFEHLGCNDPAVRFQTKSGLLTVHRNGDLLTLDFPSLPPMECPAPAELIEGLGAAPIFTGKSMDFFAVLDSESEVRCLQPKLDVLARLDARGIIVTAPGNECDFVSRFFAPASGIPEDPVTGSAHCSLTPYWAARLKKSSMVARQISTRGGEIHCEQHGDRVRLSGKAVTYMTGFIHLPHS